MNVPQVPRKYQIIGHQLFKMATTNVSAESSDTAVMKCAFWTSQSSVYKNTPQLRWIAIHVGSVIIKKKESAVMK